MALIGQAVSEEKIFEIVDGQTDDGRTPDHGHPISSPCEPNGSGELNIIPQVGSMKSQVPSALQETVLSPLKVEPRSHSNTAVVVELSDSSATLAFAVVDRVLHGTGMNRN